MEFLRIVLPKKTPKVKYKLHEVRCSGKPHILKYRVITKKFFFQHYQSEAAGTGSLVFQLSEETLITMLCVDDVRHCSTMSQKI
jgi:hypothetical protein